jgi:hypothetical protein
MRTSLWKYFIDEEKTENWLNELSAEGLQCIGTGCLMHKYYFEQGDPNEYTYRFTIMDHGMGHKDTRQYLAFLHDNGIEYVAHGYRHFLLRKKAADGPFELYTDRASQIKSNQTLMHSAIFTAAILFVIGALNAYIVYLHITLAHDLAGIMTFVNGSGALFCFIILAYMLEQWRRYAGRINQLKREGEIHE